MTQPVRPHACPPELFRDRAADPSEAVAPARDRSAHSLRTGSLGYFFFAMFVALLVFASSARDGALGIGTISVGHAQSAPAQEPAARILLPMTLANQSLAALPDVSTAPPRTATSAPPPTNVPRPSPVPSEPPPATPTEAPPPTLVPTEPPTAPPTATATATPEASPTPALACENIVKNGDFESGARDWTLVVTTQEQPLNLAIVRRAEGPIPPQEGDIYAYLGGLNDTSFWLTSRRLPRFDTEGIERATLSVWAALISEEQPDRRPGDRLRAFVDTGRRTYIDELTRSEEDLQPQRTWQQLTADVTPYLDRGANYVGVEVINDRGRNSWFYLDDVRLELCRLP